MKLHPRFAILYILLVSILIFSNENIYITCSLLGLQIILWLIFRIPLGEIRRFKKVISFAIALLFFHGFFSGKNSLFVFFSLFGWKFEVTRDGLLTGLFMLTKMVTMLASTFLIRLLLKPEEFMRGLKGLGLSENMSQILDAILEIIESSGHKTGSGQGGGRGMGGGKGQGRGKGMGGGQRGGGGSGRKNQEGEQLEQENTLTNSSENRENTSEDIEEKIEKEEDSQKSGFTIKAVVKGDFHFIIEMANKRFDEFKGRFANHEIAMLASISLIVTLIRFIKVAPGFPIAPGHKNVILIPFFILATRLTSMKFPGVRIGFISGVIHLMAGFGKYGPFGLLEFIVLGLTIDLLSLLTLKSNSFWIFLFIGFVGGATRITAAITVALLLGMPLEYYMVYTPYIVAQCVFGMMSAPLTLYLVKHFYLERKEYLGGAL